MGEVPIRTIGDLRQALESREADEPLVCYYDRGSLNEKTELEIGTVGSTGGGRVTVLWFDKVEREGPEDLKEPDAARRLRLIDLIAVTALAAFGIGLINSGVTLFLWWLLSGDPK